MRVVMPRDPELYRVRPAGYGKMWSFALGRHLTAMGSIDLRASAAALALSGRC